MLTLTTIVGQGGVGSLTGGQLVGCRGGGGAVACGGGAGVQLVALVAQVAPALLAIVRVDVPAIRALTITHF